jgi:hypothetical protein
MRRRQYIRGNFDRRDAHRPILTESAPHEVPIIFSNDGFYTNLSQANTAVEGLRDLIEHIVTKNPRLYTVPYRYKIAKTTTTARQLSLLHPAAQFGVCEFYRQYETLICYYCNKSDFSIRYPAKIGSSYFFKGTLSERNKYRRDGIDTVSLDKVVRNPTSYFAYREYDRLYKFFKSNDFVRLERKFSVMTFLDIGNCFGSIYTHAMPWAVKDIHHAKQNVRASSFESNFDRLMQRMNFNETNGICIGPEVSRIFAEIILQRVDQNILALATKLKLQNKVHYECRRYVDDYLVFAQNAEIAHAIQNIVAECLSEFHLHLNEQKRETYTRPFQTEKSQAIAQIDKKIGEFYARAFDRKENKLRSLVPKRLYKPDAAVRSFIEDVKSSCFELGVGYEMVSNYVISSLGTTIEDLIESFAEIKDQPHNENEAGGNGNKQDAMDELFVTSFIVLLEIIYFLYTVHPTVASSFQVAKATILTSRFFRSSLPNRNAYLSERLSNWLMAIVRGNPSDQVARSKGTVPIEVINIVLALSELPEDYMMDADYIQTRVFEISNANYFTLISCLFYIKNIAKYSGVKDAIKKRVLEMLANCDVVGSAHDAHLFLDLICCQFLDMDFRKVLLKEIRSKCELPALTNQQLQETVTVMMWRPWFVRWITFDLLNMVKKKELSAVY